MKKIIVSLLFLLPLGLVAQELKIAFVNTNEVLNVMPEVSDYESKIATLRQTMDGVLKEMQDDYVRKYTEFTAQSDSLTENIRNLKIQEIQQLEMRISNYAEASQEDYSKKSDELFLPIQEKLMKAIESVGAENGYIIFDSRTILYKGAAIDASDKVKAKLGL